MGSFAFEAEELNAGVVSASFSVTDIQKPVEIVCSSAVDNAWLALDIAILETKQSASNSETYVQLLDPVIAHTFQNWKHFVWSQVLQYPKPAKHCQLLKNIQFQRVSECLSPKNSHSQHQHLTLPLRRQKTPLDGC